MVVMGLIIAAIQVDEMEEKPAHLGQWGHTGLTYSLVQRPKRTAWRFLSGIKRQGFGNIYLFTKFLLLMSQRASYDCPLL